MLQFCRCASGLKVGGLNRDYSNSFAPAGFGRVVRPTRRRPRDRKRARDSLPPRRALPLPGGCMPDVDPVVEAVPQTGFDGMLARAAAKDRTHIQRHLAAADAES